MDTANRQQLRSASMGPRKLLAVLALLTTGCGTWVYSHVVGGPQDGVFTIVLLVLLTVLLLWISLSFWIATAGFVRRLCGAPSLDLPSSQTSRVLPPDGRTAILMPVFNESPQRVFAGLRAIYESLQATGHGTRFDFFILSDSTDPDVWIAEELAWARLNQAVTGASSVFYRHRARNEGRKAGNIADFCQRWGSAYRYMTVLDADSIMSGETLVEMTRRMDQDPAIGILQAPPLPVNRVSLFARCQQFAARVYGPVFLEGFAWWSGTDSNYWGHNAILRVHAFTESCGLSPLPGHAPLGGEILSHDFVEAALMRRAGWKVCIAHDLEGSYEECPPTLIDYARRDNRWCQGNMQHIRLVFSARMHPVSRLHLGMGVMSYLSSPLWLIFLVLSFVWAALAPADGNAMSGRPGGTNPWWAAGLFTATMAMLMLPKLWSYILLVSDRQRLAKCGGATKAAASVAIETLISVLVAPVMMAFHATFVLSTLAGRRVSWAAQPRNEQGQALAAAVSAHWQQTVAGTLAAILVWVFAPAMFFWLVPVLAGLIFSIPLSVWLSSVGAGQALARQGLLLTPEETSAPQVLQRHRHLLALPPPKELTDFRGMFRRILADPALLALHRCILQATDAATEADAQQILLAKKQLLAGGPFRVSVENRRAILSDPEALRDLHLFAWTSTRKGDADPVDGSQ